MKWRTLIWISYLIATCLIKSSSGRGVLTIWLLNYKNVKGRTYDGNCCDDAPFGSKTCPDQCDYVMRCIVTGLGRANDHVFLFHRPIKYDSNDISFDGESSQMSQLTVLFDEWPSSGNVKMDVFFYDYDDFDHTTVLVDWFETPLRRTVEKGERQMEVVRGSRQLDKTILEFKWTVHCFGMNDCLSPPPEWHKWPWHPEERTQLLFDSSKIVAINTSHSATTWKPDLKTSTVKIYNQDKMTGWKETKHHWADNSIWFNQSPFLPFRPVRPNPRTTTEDREVLVDVEKHARIIDAEERQDLPAVRPTGKIINFNSQVKKGSDHRKHRRKKTGRPKQKPEASENRQKIKTLSLSNKNEKVELAGLNDLTTKTDESKNKFQQKKDTPAETDLIRTPNVVLNNFQKIEKEPLEQRSLNSKRLVPMVPLEPFDQKHVIFDKNQKENKTDGTLSFENPEEKSIKDIIIETEIKAGAVHHRVRNPFLQEPYKTINEHRIGKFKTVDKKTKWLLPRSTESPVAGVNTSPGSTPSEFQTIHENKNGIAGEHKSTKSTTETPNISVKKDEPLQGSTKGEITMITSSASRDSMVSKTPKTTQLGNKVVTDSYEYSDVISKERETKTPLPSDKVTLAVSKHGENKAEQIFSVGTIDIADPNMVTKQTKTPNDINQSSSESTSPVPQDVFKPMAMNIPVRLPPKRGRFSNKNSKAMENIKSPFSKPAKERNFTPVKIRTESSSSSRTSEMTQTTTPSSPNLKHNKKVIQQRRPTTRKWDYNYNWQEHYKDFVLPQQFVPRVRPPTAVWTQPPPLRGRQDVQFPRQHIGINQTGAKRYPKESLNKLLQERKNSDVDYGYYRDKHNEFIINHNKKIREEKRKNQLAAKEPKRTHKNTNSRRRPKRPPLKSPFTPAQETSENKKAKEGKTTNGRGGKILIKSKESDYQSPFTQPHSLESKKNNGNKVNPDDYDTNEKGKVLAEPSSKDVSETTNIRRLKPGVKDSSVQKSPFTPPSTRHKIKQKVTTSKPRVPVNPAFLKRQTRLPYRGSLVPGQGFTDWTDDLVTQKAPINPKAVVSLDDDHLHNSDHLMQKAPIPKGKNTWLKPSLASRDPHLVDPPVFSNSQKNAMPNIFYENDATVDKPKKQTFDFDVASFFSQPKVLVKEINGIAKNTNVMFNISKDSKDNSSLGNRLLISVEDLSSIHVKASTASRLTPSFIKSKKIESPFSSWTTNATMTPTSNIKHIGVTNSKLKPSGLLSDVEVEILGIQSAKSAESTSSYPSQPTEGIKRNSYKKNIFKQKNYPSQAVTKSIEVSSQIQVNAKTNNNNIKIIRNKMKLRKTNMNSRKHNRNLKKNQSTVRNMNSRKHNLRKSQSTSRNNKIKSRKSDINPKNIKNVLQSLKPVRQSPFYPKRKGTANKRRKVTNQVRESTYSISPNLMISRKSDPVHRMNIVNSTSEIISEGDTSSKISIFSTTASKSEVYNSPNRKSSTPEPPRLSNINVSRSTYQPLLSIAITPTKPSEQTHHVVNIPSPPRSDDVKTTGGPQIPGVISSDVYQDETDDIFTIKTPLAVLTPASRSQSTTTASYRRKHKLSRITTSLYQPNGQMVTQNKRKLSKNKLSATSLPKTTSFTRPKDPKRNRKIATSVFKPFTKPSETSSHSMPNMKAYSPATAGSDQAVSPPTEYHRFTKKQDQLFESFKILDDLSAKATKDIDTDSKLSDNPYKMSKELTKKIRKKNGKSESTTYTFTDISNQNLATTPQTSAIFTISPLSTKYTTSPWSTRKSTTEWITHSPRANILNPFVTVSATNVESQRPRLNIGMDRRTTQGGLQKGGKVSRSSNVLESSNSTDSEKSVSDKDSDSVTEGKMNIFEFLPNAMKDIYFGKASDGQEKNKHSTHKIKTDMNGFNPDYRSNYHLRDQQVDINPKENEEPNFDYNDSGKDKKFVNFLFRDKNTRTRTTTPQMMLSRRQPTTLKPVQLTTALQKVDPNRTKPRNEWHQSDLSSRVPSRWEHRRTTIAHRTPPKYTLTDGNQVGISRGPIIQSSTKKALPRVSIIPTQSKYYTNKRTKIQSTSSNYNTDLVSRKDATSTVTANSNDSKTGKVQNILTSKPIGEIAHKKTSGKVTRLFTKTYYNPATIKNHITTRKHNTFDDRASIFSGIMTNGLTPKSYSKLSSSIDTRKHMSTKPSNSIESTTAGSTNGDKDLLSEVNTTTSSKPTNGSTIKVTHVTTNSYETKNSTLKMKNTVSPSQSKSFPSTKTATVSSLNKLTTPFKHPKNIFSSSSQTNRGGTPTTDSARVDSHIFESDSNARKNESSIINEESKMNITSDIFRWIYDISKSIPKSLFSNKINPSENLTIIENTSTESSKVVKENLNLASDSSTFSPKLKSSTKRLDMVTSKNDSHEVHSKLSTSQSSRSPGIHTSTGHSTESTISNINRGLFFGWNLGKGFSSSTMVSAKEGSNTTKSSKPNSGIISNLTSKPTEKLSVSMPSSMETPTSASTLSSASSPSTTKMSISTSKSTFSTTTTIRKTTKTNSKKATTTEWTTPTSTLPTTLTTPKKLFLTLPPWLKLPDLLKPAKASTTSSTTSSTTTTEKPTTTPKTTKKKTTSMATTKKMSSTKRMTTTNSFPITRYDKPVTKKRKQVNITINRSPGANNGPRIIIPNGGLYIPSEGDMNTTDGFLDLGVAGSSGARNQRLHGRKMNFKTVFSRYWPAILGLTVGTVFLVAAVLTSVACRQQRLYIRRTGWTDMPHHVSEPPDTSEYSSAASLVSDATRSSISFR